MKMKDMKQILKYILAVVALALVVPSCNKDFEWEGFGVNNDDTEEHCININAEEGTTTISVYSDSEWSAELEDNYDWVELSNTSGNGNGRIVFNYNANNDALRRAFVLVHSRNDSEYRRNGGLKIVHYFIINAVIAVFVVRFRSLKGSEIVADIIPLARFPSQNSVAYDRPHLHIPFEGQVQFQL